MTNAVFFTAAPCFLFVAAAAKRRPHRAAKVDIFVAADNLKKLASQSCALLTKTKQNNKFAGRKRKKKPDAVFGGLLRAEQLSRFFPPTRSYANAALFT